MGVAHDIAVGGVRMSLSRFSALQDVTNLIDQLKAMDIEASRIPRA